MVAHVAIEDVAYTPASSAIYTVLASLGSTASALAGASGRFAVRFSQWAPKSVERYTCGAAETALPKPMMVA